MPRNLLFITTDQQRRDTLGCYGNPLIRTPNLDALARDGVLFERAYCESPICIPSRITLLTGKTAAHHGATLHNTSMRSDERTLAHLLQERGYLTHCVGKMHFTSQQHRGREESIADWRDGKYAGWPRSMQPQAALLQGWPRSMQPQAALLQGWSGPYAGFQTAELVLGHSNSLIGHYGEWLRREHAGQFDKFILENMTPLPIESGWGRQQGAYANDIPQELHSSAYVADRAIAFLENARRADKPFFCFASFPDTHWPITPPHPWYEMYDDAPMPPNIPYAGEADKPNYPRTFRHMRLGGKPPYNGGAAWFGSPADVQNITRKYYGAISFIDHNIGRILARLRELGLEQDTVVLFTTDHGEFMGAHGLMFKGVFMYEAFIAVPFIVRAPGLPAGRAEGLLSFIDVVPTLCDLLGVECDLAADGLSHGPALRGERPAVRDCVRLTHFAPTTAWPDIHTLIEGDWKLNYHAGDPNGELYNLREDPSELNNRYHRPEAAEVQQRMVRRLMDEVLLCHDKAPIRYASTADRYGMHLMKREEWRAEFEELARKTGKPPSEFT